MDFPPPKKMLTPAEALARARKYCAFQERSHSEVRHKLLEYGLRGKGLEEVMVKLIDEGFLNEERFAIAFAGGKFRMKHWGKKKIEQELMRRGISDYLIEKALRELKPEDYEGALQILLEKKAASLKDRNIFARKQKLSTFLISKGYESQAVFKAVNAFYTKKK